MRALVWDPNRVEVLHTFEGHTGAILDADWKNGREFATCSVD
jgi:hypothetical protein